ncbi:MAG: sodium-dependent transporter [Lewinellaceae bacterium]|nr:sodium-dependent transporter [Phaeodactylibacter sp.]MCB0614838.1 sodium-dependent transporter [Phaeodactylibacter sp.]MCB9352133.1 sodium-dependent transporter [Lewinellaceae bacterium]
MTTNRGTWKSKLGFILAASGSAIGLGNIVFFSSNAYQYGGGAFYLPYFIALFVLGMPLMMLELGIGTMTGRSFPMALGKIAGKKGEFVGWWSIAGALFITMYYITILGWALGMMAGSLGSLFEAGATAPFDDYLKPSPAANSTVYFFNLISGWLPFFFIILIWAINLLILRKGTASIERAVRVIVPLMWIFMLILVVRGITLEKGFDGVMYLFTPDLEGIAQPHVWRGAFSQMFFSLSLGMGIMTAYASYLPRDSDQANNAMLISFLNCSFEFIAGIAIFSLLFVYALNPAGTTLSLSFFVIPQGINGISAVPWIVRLFGFLFFLLMILAGLSSSVSLIEGFASSLIDKLGITRSRALATIAIPGITGSLLFTLPQVIDPSLSGDGTLGLTLLDITDHWVFNYSLLFIGFAEVVLIGWVMGADNLRQLLNRHSRLRLGPWFTFMIRYFIPGLLAVVIASSLYNEAPLYGSSYDMPGYKWLTVFIPLFWLVSSTVFALYLTHKSTNISE